MARLTLYITDKNTLGDSVCASVAYHSIADSHCKFKNHKHFGPQRHGRVTRSSDPQATARKKKGTPYLSFGLKCRTRRAFQQYWIGLRLRTPVSQKFWPKRATAMYPVTPLQPNRPYHYLALTLCCDLIGVMVYGSSRVRYACLNRQSRSDSQSALSLLIQNNSLLGDFFSRLAPPCDSTDDAPRLAPVEMCATLALISGSALTSTGCILAVSNNRLRGDSCMSLSVSWRHPRRLLAEYRAMFLAGTPLPTLPRRLLTHVRRPQTTVCVK